MATSSSTITGPPQPHKKGKKRKKKTKADILSGADDIHDTFYADTVLPTVAPQADLAPNGNHSANTIGNDQDAANSHEDTTEIETKSKDEVPSKQDTKAAPTAPTLVSEALSTETEETKEHIESEPSATSSHTQLNTATASPATHSAEQHKSIHAEPSPHSEANSTESAAQNEAASANDNTVNHQKSRSKQLNPEYLTKPLPQSLPNETGHSSHAEPLSSTHSEEHADILHSHQKNKSWEEYQHKPLPQPLAKPKPLQTNNAATTNISDAQHHAVPLHLNVNTASNVEKTHQTWVIRRPSPLSSPGPPSPSSPSKPAIPSAPKPEKPVFDPKEVESLSPQQMKALLQRREKEQKHKEEQQEEEDATTEEDIDLRNVDIESLTPQQMKELLLKQQRIMIDRDKKQQQQTQQQESPPKVKQIQFSETDKEDFVDLMDADDDSDDPHDDGNEDATEITMNIHVENVDEEELCKCEHEEIRDGEYMRELLSNAKTIIEELLKARKPELDWRISEYLCREEIMHLFLSYVSRLPKHVNVQQICKLYTNEEGFGEDWITQTLLERNKVKRAAAENNDDDLDEEETNFLLQRIRVENRPSFVVFVGKDAVDFRHVHEADPHFVTKSENDSEADAKTETDTETKEDPEAEDEADSKTTKKHKGEDGDNDSSSSDDLEQLFEVNPESPEKMDYFDSRDRDYEEKLSHALMKILCNLYAPMEVKSFLLRNVETITFHAMLVFHPLSTGNIYHASELLNILLTYWPLQLFQTLTTSHCMVIQHLFKHAVMSRIHQWKFGEFVINFICYNNNTGNVQLQQSINKYRQILIDDMLISWNMIKLIMNVATNPQMYGDAIANKYSLFITNLIRSCALIKETLPLFKTPSNMLEMVIDRFLHSVFDENNQEKWHKINTVTFVREIIEFASKPTIMTVVNAPKTSGAVATSSHFNVMFELFEGTFNKFAEYIPSVINALISDYVHLDENELVTACSTSNRRLGLFKLGLMELLILYIDLIKLKNDNFRLPNIKQLCKSLLNMVFIYSTNNILLSKFQKFMKAISVYCVDDLKYITVECQMVRRFMTYYHSSDTARTALHAYIIQILWDIYSYHEELKEIDYEEEMPPNDDNADGIEDKESGDEDPEIPEKEWNFAQYVESNESTKQFIEMIQQQIEDNEPDEDI